VGNNFWNFQSVSTLDTDPARVWLQHNFDWINRLHRFFSHSTTAGRRGSGLKVINYWLLVIGLRRNISYLVFHQ
jgi:hypothetical protein